MTTWRVRWLWHQKKVLSRLNFDMMEIMTTTVGIQFNFMLQYTHYRSGRCAVASMLTLQSKGRWFDPPLIQSFGWDYKPRSRLHDLVVSGTLNSKHHHTQWPLTYSNIVSRRLMMIYTGDFVTLKNKPYALKLANGLIWLQYKRIHCA